MCVKEFLGYNCGHCAIPYLRQCPVSASNPTFPPCKYPAERPIFTNENCHPCSRVLWNAKVLAEEEAHRKRHQLGECDCSVIFDAADRERRLRPRSTRGKGNANERAQGEPVEAGRIEGKRFRDGERGSSNFGYDAHRNNDGPAGPRPYEYGGGGARESQQEWAPQQSKSGITYEYAGYHFEGPGPVRSDMEHLARGLGIPQGGYVPPQYLHSNTLMMDQPGAGMKWYPEKQGQLPVLPPFPIFPTVPSAPALPNIAAIMDAPPLAHPDQFFGPAELSSFQAYQEDYPRFIKKKAASEPAETRNPSFSPASDSTQVHEDDVGMNDEESPLVVSSSGVVNIMPM
ncbi:hypothetical protein ONS95_007711 [Cadophora gregata]|uniref:uncharacterized protein n=1 Tax=Cadophora gregata TaxID=51156 RepID=UPI0026DC70C7|nr:uncharacterized protein ONS95_007711 [Cadophora gregata]KAK0118832.1 hypothetical protein ONS96_011913 [Cadophora gregata f. sp. sojae]KAK0126092.1 hypothetical protein ONS95_007711 [Cadophora gregata]